jgi:hypothetical protein
VTGGTLAATGGAADAAATVASVVGGGGAVVVSGGAVVVVGSVVAVAADVVVSPAAAGGATSRTSSLGPASRGPQEVSARTARDASQPARRTCTTTPTVGPDQVDQMADQGVQTLFIQTAKHDTPDLIAERDLLDPILARAHARGIRVVAWYLPTFENNDNDLNRLVASANLDVDGLAVDIESRKVPDANERSARLVDLSNRLRAALPGRAIGAIVMPPVQMEVVNPNFWPGFPWQQIAPNFDVWQTMGYWTDRKPSSGYRDPYTYTNENLRRLRANLGNPSAPVSPVGGVGAMGEADVEAFLRAAVENQAMGGSIYDWRTTNPEAWPSLRKFRTGG